MSEEIEYIPEPDPRSYPQVLTMEEAADFLRLSRPTLLQAVMRKEIPAQKIGNQWRFHLQSLIEHLSGKGHVLRSRRKK